MTKEPLEVIFDFAAKYKVCRSDKAREQVDGNVRDYLLQKHTEKYDDYWSLYFLRRNR